MKNIGLSLVALVLFFGCENSEKDTHSCLPKHLAYPEDIKNLSLSQQLDALLDSVNYFKRRCFASEDIKSNLARNLIAALAAYPKADQSLVAQAKKAFEQAENSRYTEATFSDDQTVTTYDNFTLQYVDALRNLRNRLGSLDVVPNGERDFEAIDKANTDDTFLRLDYNRFALFYNSIINCYPENTKRLGGKHRSAKPIAYFYGSPPEELKAKGLPDRFE